MINIVVSFREIKKYFTCYVLLRQQIISAAKISAINEAAIDLKKLQVWFGNRISRFLQKSEEKKRFMFVKQIFHDLHFVFERQYVWQREFLRRWDNSP